LKYLKKQKSKKAKDRKQKKPKKPKNSVFIFFFFFFFFSVMTMEVKLLSFRILLPAFLAALIYAFASSSFFKPPAISITSDEGTSPFFFPL
jgi:hypothetical protein